VEIDEENDFKMKAFLGVIVIVLLKNGVKDVVIN
jgi:hypothetical protein